MLSSFLRSSSRFFFSIGALSVTLALAACGGGGSGTVVPNAPTISQVAPPVQDSSEISLGTLSVDPSDTTALAATLDAQAFASPVIGRQPMLSRVTQLIERATSYPDDLAYNGGPVVKAAKSIDLYVNCAASCWGTPSTFQANLSKSTFVHLLDQYIHLTSNYRYTYGGSVAVSYATNKTLQDSDIYSIIHAAAKKYGAGYGVMYHVFLARGVNECSNNAGGCYSPSNPSNWTYCAYHGYNQFSDVGHVLYSVEPYQNVNGCQVTGRSPNGLLVDSTASTLSHESFEAFTDPDVPTNIAWYNNNLGEIGDICAPANGVATGVVALNGHNYGIQPEYSNKYHKCTFSI